jgi:hypothetical protein
VLVTVVSKLIYIYIYIYIYTKFSFQRVFLLGGFVFIQSIMLICIQNTFDSNLQFLKACELYDLLKIHLKITCILNTNRFIRIKLCSLCIAGLRMWIAVLNLCLIHYISLMLCYYLLGGLA